MSETTKVQHTPEPWAVWAPEEDGFEGQYEIVSEYFADGGKRFVAQMVAKCCSDAQEADAYLIAAAPELLEACREAEDLLAGYDQTPEESAVWDRLRSAIAKAEGR